MIRPYRFSCVLELGLSKKFDPLILACILRALHLERVTKRDSLKPFFTNLRFREERLCYKKFYAG